MSSVNQLSGPPIMRVLYGKGLERLEQALMSSEIENLDIQATLFKSAEG
jgi:hypothetical protein